jgi:uncharacterized protein YkwD
MAASSEPRPPHRSVRSATRTRPPSSLRSRDPEGAPPSLAEGSLATHAVQPIRAPYSGVMRSPLALAIVVALVAAGSVLGLMAVTAPRAAAQRGPQAAFSARGVTHMPALEEHVLASINNLRQEHGLVALRLNPQLVATARAHSLSMAEQGYFRHASFSGSPFWKRVGQKYPVRRARFWTVGENLVWASPGLSAGQVLRMWLSSPPHRRNLLTPAWREIGLGAVHAPSAPGVYEGRNATILTADFGVRRR